MLMLQKKSEKIGWFGKNILPLHKSSLFLVREVRTGKSSNQSFCVCKLITPGIIPRYSPKAPNCEVGGFYFFILYHTQLKTPEEVECADSSVPYPAMPFRVCHPLPLFWPLLMSGACHQFRPRRVVFYGCFQYKRSFLSQCWCKGTIFLSRKQEYGKKVRKKVCKYLIYIDIYKIEFCI